MNNKVYQEFVKESASPKYDKKLAIIGLVGEVGELADVVKKEAIYEDMSKFVEKYGMSVDEMIISELGDVLWQLVCVMNMYNVSLDDIMNKNYFKLIKRHGGVKTNNEGGKR